MTNSQNRPSSGGNRYSGGGQFSPPHHHQQQQQKGGGASATSTPNGAPSKGSARKSRSQRSPSGVTYFASQSTLYFTPVRQKNPTSQSVTPTGQYHMMSSSPPNFSHFAGSKCYEAPAPTALPRPPDHWKLPTAKGMMIPTPPKMVPVLSTSSKSCAGVLTDGKSDIFSHNLKMLLNIKA